MKELLKYFAITAIVFILFIDTIAVFRLRGEVRTLQENSVLIMSVSDKVANITIQKYEFDKTIADKLEKLEKQLQKERSTDQ